MTLATLKLHQKIYDQIYHTPFSKSATTVWFGLCQQIKDDVNEMALPSITRHFINKKVLITQVQRPIRENLSQIEFK